MSPQSSVYMILVMNEQTTQWDSICMYSCACNDYMRIYKCVYCTYEYKK